MAKRARLYVVLPIAAALAACLVLLAVPGDGTDDAPPSPVELLRIDRYVKRFREAQRLFDRGDDAAAETIFRELIAEEPEAAAVHHALGILHRQSGRHVEALDSLLRAAMLDQETPVIARDAAGELLAAGRAKEAEVLYMRARRHWPDELDTLLGHGAALRALGRTADAETTLRHAVLVDPNSIDARTGLAATIVARDPREALELVAPVEQQYPDVALVRGLAKERLGKFDEAGADLLLAAQGAPLDPIGRNIVREATESLLRCGDYERAVTAATRWAGKGRTSARAAFALAMAHAGTRNASAALTALDRTEAASLPPAVSRQMAFARALLHRESGDAEKARKELTALADAEAPSFVRAMAARLLGRGGADWGVAYATLAGRTNDVLFVDALAAGDAGREAEAARLRKAAREATHPPGEFPGPFLRR